MAINKTLHLARDICDNVVSHCQRCYPKEACGIVGGRGNKGEIVYALENVSDSPRLCYFIDPREQLRVFKDLRGRGLAPLAIYHSHTGSPAYPSSRDIELAFYPESFYVIVSLQDKDQPQLRAFRIVEGKIEESEIKGTEDTSCPIKGLKVS